MTSYQNTKLLCFCPRWLCLIVKGFMQLQTATSIGYNFLNKQSDYFFCKFLGENIYLGSQKMRNLVSLSNTAWDSGLKIGLSFLNLDGWLLQTTAVDVRSHVDSVKLSSRISQISMVIKWHNISPVAQRHLTDCHQYRKPTCLYSAVSS